MRSAEFNYWEKYKQREILRGENCLDPSEEKKKKIEEINEWMRSQIKPRDTSESEKGYEKNFEQLCILLQTKVQRDIKKMTVLEFCTLNELIKKKKI